ncbi:hypothetical protein MBLNU459_g0893t1 [Dothideomycetes sp. NU459]
MASDEAIQDGANVVKMEEVTMRRIDSRISHMRWERRGSTTTNVDPNELVNAARDATEKEHQMSLLKALRTYPNAVAWSIVASTVIVMEGYDLVTLYNFFGFPAFTKKYGVLTPDGTYQMTAAWQSGLVNGSCVGEVFGLFMSAIIADKYGYRMTIVGALAMLICFIFITFFANSVEVLLVGEILCGIPWGCFQTITTSYAAEVTPVQLRPYLTSYINLCWVMGQLLGIGVLRGLTSRTDEWAYRIPFALQWFWPIPLIIGITCAPESPWWLVRKGRLEDAVRSVTRLTSKKREPDFDAQKAVAMMIHTNQLEMELTVGTSYLDCFRGVDLRRTEICCMVWMMQALCGAGIMTYSTYFFEQAGLSTENAFNLGLAQYGLGVIGVFTSWALMPWFGRRTLYLGGMAALCVLLLCIGFISLAHQDATSAWATGAMLLVYAFVYDSTIGPVCFSLVAELSSTRLRQKTIALARNAYIVTYIVSNVLFPRMFNPTAWNWRGKAGFFWAGICFLSIIWAYFRLPEPNGRTYAELDVLFQQKVPAREFSTTMPGLFHGNATAVNSVSSLDSDGKQSEVMSKTETQGSREGEGRCELEHQPHS